MAGIGRRTRSADNKEVVTRPASRTSQPLDWELALASLSEPELFAEVFERHFAAIHGYLARRAGVSVADDLVSDVFLVAFERRARVRVGSESLRPWLYGIATNLLRNRARSERRHLVALARLEHRAAATASGLAPDAVTGLVHLGRVLSQLEPDLRDVLLLHAWEGLSHSEISAALEIPMGTVASRLSRGRHRLRTALESDEAVEGTLRPCPR